MSHLVVRVHMHAARYHGRPEWPPAPARLFQALVAGASGRLREPSVQAALRWLEALPPPAIGSPRHEVGQAVTYFVPNNDLDAKDGDPGRLAEIRTAKVTQPHLLSANVPFVYVWTYEQDEDHAHQIVELAEGLYQFGRGLDMAWATSEVISGAALADLCATYDGVWHRPTPGAGRGGLACPRAGSFDSLERRFAAQGERFRVEGSGRAAVRVFAQPPKPVFSEVAYGRGPARFVFELRDNGRLDRPPVPVPLERSHALVAGVRDAAAARLTAAIDAEELVSAVLVGRRPGEPERLPQEQRVRIVPLPSIGHRHTDPRVRRVLVEIPHGGPLPVDDLRWAFAGLVHEHTTLVPAEDERMLAHYMRAAKRWQSVTPAALPSARRRIDPERRAEEAKGAPERHEEEAAAKAAVRQALRHAGVTAAVARIDVRREPYLRQGARAEAFAVQPRFPKERLWHVEIVFKQPVAGPLVLGDGRYLGLGVMAPAGVDEGTYAWRIRSGLREGASPLGVAASLRRAVLARAQTVWGPRADLPTWITGHGEAGAPAEGHDHLHFVADLARERVFVIDRRVKGWGRPKLARALEGLTELRAGAAGLLVLEPADVEVEGDPVLGQSRRWRSITPYRVERHLKRVSAVEAIQADLRHSCRRAKLPEPVEVAVSQVRARAGVGLEAQVDVTFETSVPGPLLLGRSRHLGGGAFEAIRS